MLDGRIERWEGFEGVFHSGAGLTCPVLLSFREFPVVHLPIRDALPNAHTPQRFRV